MHCCFTDFSNTNKWNLIEIHNLIYQRYFSLKGKKGENDNLSSVREKNSKCLFIFLLNAEDVFSGSHKAHLC